MRIFTGSFTFRVHALMWLAVIVTLYSLFRAYHTWTTGDLFHLENAIILFALAYPMAMGMWFYANRYVTALDIEDGLMVIRTRGLIFNNRIIDTADLGEAKTDKRLRTDVALVITALTGTLDALRFAGINNQYHLLSVGPRKHKYIVDVSVDPEAVDRIAAAMEALSDPSTAPREISAPGWWQRFRAELGFAAWTALHVTLLLAALSFGTHLYRTAFADNAVQTVAFVTGLPEGAVEYRFDTADGTPVEASKPLPQEVAAGLRVGAEIPVWYQRDEPEFNAVEPPDGSGEQTLAVFAVLSGVALLFFVIRAGWRLYPILRSAGGVLVLLSTAGFAGALGALAGGSRATGSVEAAAGLALIAILLILLAIPFLLLKRRRLRKTASATD